MTHFPPTLSAGIAALLADLRPHEPQGLYLSGAEVRTLCAVLAIWHRQALALDLGSLIHEPCAPYAHLEVELPPLSAQRAALVAAAQPIPGTNVVSFPLAPIRLGEDEGDVA